MQWGHCYKSEGINQESWERCRGNILTGRMAVNVTKCRHVIMSINISAGKEVGNISSKIKQVHIDPESCLGLENDDSAVPCTSERSRTINTNIV